jgi:hypothetical protein
MSYTIPQIDLAGWLYPWAAVIALALLAVQTVLDGWLQGGFVSFIPDGDIVTALQLIQNMLRQALFQIPQTLAVVCLIDSICVLDITFGVKVRPLAIKAVRVCIAVTLALQIVFRESLLISLRSLPLVLAMSALNYLMTMEVPRLDRLRVKYQVSDVSDILMRFYMTVCAARVVDHLDTLGDWSNFDSSWIPIAIMLVCDVISFVILTEFIDAKTAYHCAVWTLATGFLTWAFSLSLFDPEVGLNVAYSVVGLIITSRFRAMLDATYGTGSPATSKVK